MSPRLRNWATVALIAAGLSVLIFAFYFGTYAVRHEPLPAGFDAPWYVWRASFVAERGIGPVGTALRPGHAVLSAVLGSVTGISQLELVVVLSQVLPVLLALAVGAFAWSLPRANRAAWVTAIAVTGAVLGATRLVGENLANLLNLALEVGALALLVSATGRRRAAWGAIALVVAAGLSHWVFLAVIGLVLIADVALARRLARSAGPDLALSLERERSAMLRVTAISGVVVAILVIVVLRAPFRTFEIALNPHEFTPKLVTDVSRLWLAGVLGLLGFFVMRRTREDRSEPNPIATSFPIRLVVVWAVVTAACVLVSLVTLALPKLSLPPHRFLALFVAFPVVIAAAEAIRWGARWVRRTFERFRAGRIGGAAGAMTVVVAVGALAAISAGRWYRYPVLMTQRGQQEADTLAGYVEQLPPSQPFVVVVDPQGPANIYSAQLSERMLRIAIPPDRQEQLHLFVGSPSDLRSGTRTHFSTRIDHVDEPYWKDVAKLLPEHPPVVVLQDMGRREYREAVALGASEIAPGIALLQGPSPVTPLPVAPLPDAVPSWPVGLALGALLVVVVAVAGAGWTRLFLGTGAAPEAALGVAPVVGAGMLLLGGFLATEAGLRPHGAGGIVVFVVVTLAGIAAALARSSRRASDGSRASGGVGPGPVVVRSDGALRPYDGHR